MIPTLTNGGRTTSWRRPSAILAKLNAVPFEQIGHNLNGTLKAVNDIANGHAAASVAGIAAQPRWSRRTSW